MPTAASLYFGIVTGALGLAFIIHGRRTAKIVPVVSGVLLCGYTYFVDGWLWLCVIGALLLAAPFVIDF
jgi:hypothetical protein